MAANQVVIAVVGENAQLRKSLADSERRVKGLEKQINKSKRGWGDAFGPLKKSASGAAGPVSGLGGIFSRLSGAASGMSGPMAGVAIGLVGVAEGIDLIGDGLDKLKALTGATKQLERETGMSTETSSAWVSVGDRFGLSAQQLSTNFSMLSKRIKVASGDTKAADKQLQIFAQAGVSQSLLKSRDLDKILIRVADRFKSMPAGVDRTDLAMKLFGRSGKQLIPILSQGGSKVNALKKEMALLGLTISEKTKNKVTDLTRAQKILKQVWDGMQIQLATAVIPKLSAFADAIKNAVLGLKQGKRPAGEFAGKLYDVGKAAGKVADAIGRIASTVSSISNGPIGKGVKNALGSLFRGLGDIIPHADGGIITRPQVGLVGEAGPEAIIPLSRPARAASIMRQAGLSGGSGTVFNIYNYGNALDEGALASKIGWQLAARGVS